MRMLLKAFSLVELLIIVIIIGVLAAVTVPRVNFAILTKHETEVIAKRLSYELRKTRSLAISDAANNQDGYEFEITSEVSSLPKPIEYTAGIFNILAEAEVSVAKNTYIYQIINLSDEKVVESNQLDTDADISGGTSFKFGPLGNLLTGSDTSLTVSTDNKAFQITISSATGLVKCIEINNP